MAKDLTTGQSFTALLIAGLVIWWLIGRASHSEADKQAAAIEATSPMSPPDIVSRLKTLSSVSTALPPSPQNGNKFVVAVKQVSVFDGGMTIQEVLHTVHNHIGNTPYQGVQVDMVEAVRDHYGHDTNLSIFRLDYSNSDIRKIEFEHIMVFDILNLATVQSLDVNSLALVADECGSDGDLTKYAFEFCRKAAGATLIDPMVVK